MVVLDERSFFDRERSGSAVSIHGCNTNAAANESRARHLAPHRAQANSRAGPVCQCLALRERWQCAALTERVSPAAASRFPGAASLEWGTERFFQPQRRFILRHHLFFGPLLGLVEEAGGLFAGAEQLKVQRFIIRRGKHPLPCLVGDSLPRAEAKKSKEESDLMKKVNLSWAGAVLVFALLLWCTAATPGTIADPSTYTCAVYSTALSLLPPVVAIVLALNTKEVYTSLLVGIATGALLFANGNLELALNTLFFNEDGGMVAKLSDSSNVGILVFLVMLGILVALMNKAGGSAALWPLGVHPHPHPRGGAVHDPCSGGAHLCGRLLQLPDRRLRHAACDRPAEGLPRKAGLPHRRHGGPGLHHRAGVQLGGGRHLLGAGRFGHQRLYHVPAHHSV